MPTLIKIRDVMTKDLEIFFEHLQDLDTMHMTDFSSRDKDDFIASWDKILANPKIIKKTVVFGDKVVGNVMCFKKARKQLIGYWIGEAYWDIFIATEALKIFLEQINFRPLYAYVGKYNLASVHVLEKCGFIIRRRNNKELMLELLESKTRSQSLHVKVSA